MSTDSKVLAHISGADQRPNLQDDVGAHHGDDRPKHQAGVDNSHLNTDAKDEKSIAVSVAKKVAAAGLMCGSQRARQGAPYHRYEPITDFARPSQRTYTEQTRSGV